MPVELKSCTAKKQDGSPCPEPRADQGDEATNRHCRTHQREAQKKYIMTKNEQDYARAFRAGVSTLREHLEKNFGLYKYQKFTGPEIAGIIHQAELPKGSSLPSAEVPADAVPAAPALPAVENVQHVA